MLRPRILDRPAFPLLETHRHIRRVFPPPYSESGTASAVVFGCSSQSAASRSTSFRGLTRMASRRIQKQVSVWNARTGRALFAMRAGILYRARRCNVALLGGAVSAAFVGWAYWKGRPTKRRHP